MRRKRRKLKYQHKVLLIFLISFLILASLLYWFIVVLNDPIYRNYNINLPSPLKNIQKHDYQFDKLKLVNNYYTYEDDKYLGILGIDVSGHNGNIDWLKVKESGIKFVYLRVGFRGYGNEGHIIKDELFENYYQDAKKVGLKIGVYFFSQAISHLEAMEEAFFTLKQIQHKQIDLPIAYDLEDIDYDKARIDVASEKRRTECALVFCQKIKENNKQALIYANKYWLNNVYNPNLILNYPLWYAQYDSLPDSDYPFFIWQYSDKGKVEGIDKETDLNLLFQKKK